MQGTTQAGSGQLVSSMGKLSLENRTAITPLSLTIDAHRPCGKRQSSDEGSVADISSRSFKPGLEGNDRVSFSPHFFFWSL
jgi:hypothetical protein